MRLPIFLDTDPGIDDAAAIAAALFAPELDLQLMTTVAGNVSVEKTTRNGLQLLHFWDADVPLAQGAAAALVFRSGLEIVMCGLDVTNQAVLTPEYLSTLPALNKTGSMLHALFSHYRSGSMQSGLRMHDLCAIAWLVRPDLFTLHSCFVAVETQGQYTAGTTVVDIEGRLGQPANAQVALDLDVDGFRQWVAEVFARAP